MRATQDSANIHHDIQRGMDVSNLMPDGRSERPGPDSGFTSWTKSSLSFANGNCVEVANLPGGHVGVRDSKDAAGLVLRFTPDEWHAFLAGVRNGEFDRFAGLSQEMGLGVLFSLGVDKITDLDRHQESSHLHR
jgi:hypothetical protein